MIFSLIVFGSRPRTKVLGQVQLSRGCPLTKLVYALLDSGYPAEETKYFALQFCGYQEQVDDAQVRRWFP